MTQGNSNSDAKRRALRQMSALHPHPDAVHDPLFAHSDFFDPRDLVQVRYEMVRRVQRDRESVAVVRRAFGVSRSTFWRVHAAFTRAGLPGLVPHRRGPRHPSKLGATVMAVVARAREADPELSLAAVAERIQECCAVSVHPRSIQRRLAQFRKKGGSPLP